MVMLIINIGEEDSRAVTDKFKDLSARYYQFGTNLNISPGELDGIRNEISIHDLLQEVVLEFLRSPREKYKPTWRTIVDAVFDINPALAKEIAEHHPGRFMLLCLLLILPCHTCSHTSTHYILDLILLQMCCLCICMTCLYVQVYTHER